MCDETAQDKAQASGSVAAQPIRVLYMSVHPAEEKVWRTAIGASVQACTVAPGYITTAQSKSWRSKWRNAGESYTLQATSTGGTSFFEGKKPALREPGLPAQSNQERPLPLAVCLQRPLLTKHAIMQTAKETFKGPVSIFTEQTTNSECGAER